MDRREPGNDQEEENRKQAELKRAQEEHQRQLGRKVESENS